MLSLSALASIPDPSTVLTNAALAQRSATRPDGGEARRRVNVPRGPIGSSLAALAAQTGISVGMAGPLPPLVTPPVRGVMTPGEALRRMLAGSSLRAVRLDANTYRIEPDPVSPSLSARRARPPRPRNPAPPLPQVTGLTVVVGQKRGLNLDRIGVSAAVVPLSAGLDDRALPDTAAIAQSIDGLALTNLGPGRNRLFIRGVADSPFNGPSQSTVAVQLDDARVTFNAPDPDLRLVDVAQVEILKGPQGPLYGSGALGGIYRIVTNRPQLSRASARAGAFSMITGGDEPGAGVEGVINLPVLSDRVAVRAVGYASREPGWIDDIGLKHDANHATLRGGRLAVRARVGRWTADLAGTAQNNRVADTQYTLGSGAHRHRLVAVREPSSSHFRAVSSTVNGGIGSLNLLIATSLIRQSARSHYDASAVAPMFGVSGAASFSDLRDYHLFNQEIRFSPASGQRWVAGLSYMEALSRTHGRITPRDQGNSIEVDRLKQRIKEYALFGEGDVGILPRFDLTLGTRLFYTVTEDETVEREGRAEVRFHKFFVSPSLALKWQAPEGGIVYLRFASASRSGGLGRSDVQREEHSFRADQLDSVELGTRLPVSRFGGRLVVAASGYFTIWDHIQSDALLPNGLVATRNAGLGHIYGAEASLDWQLGSDWRAEAGVNAQSAHLVHHGAEVATASNDLPIVPELSARIGLARGFNLPRWRGNAGVQVNYVGRSRLSFQPDLDRRMGGYALLGANVGVSRNGWIIALRGDNLFNSRANSFAFGNPFSVAESQQHTPMRPRTLTVSIARTW